MKKLLAILIIGFVLYGYIEENPGLIQSYLPGKTADKTDNTSGNTTGNTSGNITDNQQIINAFENQRSDIQVSGTGIVARTLSDDTDGSRHQRFILDIAPGQTILVAHNIDLAPRIDSLRQGDSVSFYGEYEWNSKGGVLHWTHHDPGGHHQGGWLKHKGRTYQ